MLAERYARETGIDAIGCDTSMPLGWMRRLQERLPVQGNLDPLLLVAGGEALDARVGALLEILGPQPFIFNLGHGILPEDADRACHQAPEPGEGPRVLAQPLAFPMLLAYIKAFHVIAIIAWMAGLLYLPRLFVYHATEQNGSEQSETFKVMERRLLRYITTPAMLASWVLGLILAFSGAIDWSRDGWFHSEARPRAGALGLFRAARQVDQGLRRGSQHALGAFLPHRQRSPDAAHDRHRDFGGRPAFLKARQACSARLRVCYKMSRIQFGTLSRPGLSQQKIGSPGLEQAPNSRLPAEAFPTPFP